METKNIYNFILYKCSTTFLLSVLLFMTLQFQIQTNTNNDNNKKSWMIRYAVYVLIWKSPNFFFQSLQ